MIGDVGQQEDLEAARQKKALATGASTAYVEDLREEFVRDYIWPTLRAGAVYEHTYLLGTSMARPILGKGARPKIAFNKTRRRTAFLTAAPAKGNDQVRFELAYKAIAPNLQIIAPLARVGHRFPRRRHRLRAKKTQHPRRAKQKKNIYKPRPQHLAPKPRRRRTRRSRQFPQRSHVAMDRFPREKAPDKAAEVEIGFEGRPARFP